MIITLASARARYMQESDYRKHGAKTVQPEGPTMFTQHRNRVVDAAIDTLMIVMAIVIAVPFFLIVALPFLGGI